MDTGNLTVEIEAFDGGKRSWLKGEVDSSTGAAASAYLLRAVLSDPTAPFVLDLAGVTFIDSAGLQVLPVVRRALQSPDLLTIVNPSPVVANLMTVAGLDRWLTVCPASAASARPTDLESSVSS